MRRVLVSDSSFENLRLKQYEWALFGVGVESRCDYIAKRLIAAGKTVKHILVLVFPDCSEKMRTSFEKSLHDLKGDVVFKQMASDASSNVEGLLDSVIGSGEVPNIIIDYSVMSRAWYSAILFWFYKKITDQQTTQLSLLYACGQYTNEIASKDVSIKAISAVPGCAGTVFRLAPTSVAFGLGFYGYASLCASEQLEPDNIYTVSTEEDPVHGFHVDMQPGNRELIQRAEKNFKIPLGSVVTAYQCFMNIAMTCYARNEEVILVPMGPKPHVLAATLASLSDRRICTLRVQHQKYNSDINPSGKIVVTDVSFIDVPNSHGKDGELGSLSCCV